MVVVIGEGVVKRFAKSLVRKGYLEENEHRKRSTNKRIKA